MYTFGLLRFLLNWLLSFFRSLSLSSNFPIIFSNYTNFAIYLLFRSIAALLSLSLFFHTHHRVSLSFLIARRARSPSQSLWVSLSLCVLGPLYFPTFTLFKDSSLHIWTYFSVVSFSFPLIRPVPISPSHSRPVFSIFSFSLSLFSLSRSILFPSHISSLFRLSTAFDALAVSSFSISVCLRVL